MKTFLVSLVLIVLMCSSMIADNCDCTITPYKPDPPCFLTCVSKILANASYSELTGKYGLSEDISKKIIQAREKTPDTSTGWYRNILSNSDVSRVDAQFNSRSSDIYRPDSSTTTTTTTTTTPPPR
ncbi:MAG: hypothetical protein V7609_858 [Verrucomicrobiota bacterium]